MLTKVNLQSQQQIELYQRLMASASSSPLSPWLAQMLSMQRSGLSALSSTLGLGKEFKALMSHCFAEDIAQELNELSQELQDKDSLLNILQQQREDEFLELKLLLLEDQPESKHAPVYEQQSLAVIVAKASLGYGHLWSDLGMATRKDLGLMLNQFFPKLAAKNTNNMRWKKFFYKQLCDKEGGTLCRAPSCDECKSYSECFAN